MTPHAIRQSKQAVAAATAVATGARRRAAVWRPPITPDRRVLVLSIVLQLALGLLFGHSYDTRIFLATGYLVGTGHDPYVAQNLSRGVSPRRFQRDRLGGLSAALAAAAGADLPRGVRRRARIFWSTTWPSRSR